MASGGGRRQETGTPEFKRHLRQYMRQRRLKRKTDAIREALPEAVERGSKTTQHDFRSWLGMGLRAPLNRKPRFPQRGRFEVVYTSILLAILFNEEYGPWAADVLREHSRHLRMSTVNYAEALVLIYDRQPYLFEEMRSAIEASAIRLLPSTREQAETAAAARHRYPLNLGGLLMP